VNVNVKLRRNKSDVKKKNANVNAKLGIKKER
jgi:hypothetical protein